MARASDSRPAAESGLVERQDLTTTGALVSGGLLLTVVATMFHPGGREDVHRVIFAEYAASDTWVAVHLVQFLGVLVALAGLLVLYDAARRAGGPSVLARLAAAATVATAAVWAVLQGLDGVALKQAVDAWQATSGPQRAGHFASAETIRWLEWGFQSYFRLLLGAAFTLYGAVLLRQRLVAPWVGWVAVAGGAVSVVFGVDVGYSGLASALQEVVAIAFLVTGLAFGLALLAEGLRGRRPSAGRLPHPA